MSKSMPVIQKYMTVIPETIEATATIEQANNLMAEKGIRHLPVTKGSNLFGILTDKDIKSVMAFAGADPAKLQVGDVCEENPFSVSPQSAIDEVASVMAEKKIGSALVQDNDRLVGIFTVVDALKALVEISRARYHS